MIKLTNKKKEIVGVKCSSKKDGDFIVPVADVRRDRQQVEAIEKAANIHRGSKFFSPSYSVRGYNYN